ncbi:MAG: desulfoferrodoxin [archaeon]|nr:desulfoferrodoxin [archaeon]
MGVEKINQVYKCEICGNIVEVLNVGGGELVCCGQPMKLVSEKEEDSGKEKHVPIIEKTKTGIKVKVGSIEHPMEEKHYIQWIELITENGSFKEFLKPGMKPEAEFCVKTNKITARIYCNLHGLWRSK